MRDEQYWRNLHRDCIDCLRSGQTLTALMEARNVRPNVAAYNFRKLGLSTRLQEAAGTGISPKGANGVTPKTDRFVTFTPTGTDKPKLQVKIGEKACVYVDNDDVQGLRTVISCCTLEA